MVKYISRWYIWPWWPSWLKGSQQYKPRQIVHAGSTEIHAHIHTSSKYWNANTMFGPWNAYKHIRSRIYIYIYIHIYMHEHTFTHACMNDVIQPMILLTLVHPAEPEPEYFPASHCSRTSSEYHAWPILSVSIHHDCLRVEDEWLRPCSATQQTASHRSQSYSHSLNSHYTVRNQIDRGMQTTSVRKSLIQVTK